MADKFDPAHEWNQNILRNLRYKFGDAIKDVPDRLLLSRYYDWGMMGFTDDDADVVEFLQIGQ